MILSLRRSKPMQVVRLQNIVDKVILLQTNASGQVTPITLCEKDRKKKKKKGSSGPLRGLEMIAERMIDAQKAFADTYRDRFRSSQRKRSNGWLFDMGSNLMKAGNSAAKKVRVYRFPD